MEHLSEYVHVWTENGEDNVKKRNSFLGAYSIFV